LPGGLQCRNSLGLKVTLKPNTSALTLLLNISASFRRIPSKFDTFIAHSMLYSFSFAFLLIR
jgi:hypothetical protein